MTNGRARGEICLAYTVVTLLTALCLGSFRPASAQDSISGQWVVDKEASSHIGPWRNLELDIEKMDDVVVIHRKLGAGRYGREDSVTIPTDGTIHEVVVAASAKWLEQPHLGVFHDGESLRKTTGEWTIIGTDLHYVLNETLRTSTGSADVEIERSLSLSEDGAKLIWVEKRSTRPSPLTFVFTRK